MTEKRSYEERMCEFEISLINEPLDLTAHFEVVPLTARQIANRRWGMDRREDERRKELNK